MPVDIGSEVNKLFDNESYKHILRLIFNPLGMAIMIVVIILLCIYVSGPNYIKIGFYTFIVILIGFTVHDAVLIRDLNSEKIDSDMNFIIILYELQRKEI
jgi:cell division protein FtsW (lipid II flippase)